jgi:hypothetical protein
VLLHIICLLTYRVITYCYLLKEAAIYVVLPISMMAIRINYYEIWYISSHIFIIPL